MSVFEKWTKDRNISSYEKELSPTDFYTANYGFFLFAFALSLVCQLFSAYSETNFFMNDMLEGTFEGIILVIISAFLALFVIEIAKFFVFKSLLKNYYTVKGEKKLSPTLLIIAIILSCVSIYISVIGGGKMGIDKTKIVATEVKYNDEITQIRTEIKEIQNRNTWKGNTWLPAKEKNLLLAKEKELSNLKSQKNISLSNIDKENQAKELQYRWWFGCFELVYVIATIFVYYFKQRSVVERGLVVEGDNGLSQIGFNQVKTPNQANTTQPQSKIGFQFGQIDSNENSIVRTEDFPLIETKIVYMEGYRECKHCNKSFLYNHKKHIYCSDACKLANWIKNNPQHKISAYLAQKERRAKEKHKKQEIQNKDNLKLFS
jgi:branched-subunit amino acid transport protein AzlD